jgi:hypothetical protein
VHASPPLRLEQPFRVELTLLLAVDEVEDVDERVHVLVAQKPVHVAREPIVVLLLGDLEQPASARSECPMEGV